MAGGGRSSTGTERSADMHEQLALVVVIILILVVCGITLSAAYRVNKCPKCGGAGCDKCRRPPR